MNKSIGARKGVPQSDSETECLPYQKAPQDFGQGRLKVKPKERPQ